ncbi:MAG: hypothetical protein HDS12_00240 [Bacteroides sp.]|nr:hypothetical protein [Bacteroides sp.]
MKRIQIIYFLLTLGIYLCCPTFAEPQHLLIFQKSGKIESFDADIISSIELSEEDENGIVKEGKLNQVFNFDDKSVFIPVADIDSVVFGDKNVILPKPGARKIHDEDLPFISAYDGTTLTYSSSASSSILPHEGEKIYYDGFCKQFPFGLCGMVKSKTNTSNGSTFTITEIPPSEIFDEYIVSGNFDYVPDRPTRAEFNGGFLYDSELDMSPVRLKSEVKGTLSFRNFVGSPTRDYYSADIYIGNEIGLDINIHSEDSGLIELESPALTVAKGTIAGILYPQLDLSLFSDLEAMLSLGLKLYRSPSIHYKWTRENGENTFSLINDEQESSLNDTDEATLDILLEGSLHLGLKADLSLNTLFNRVGTGIKAKIGPEFSGEFGAGMISKMQEEYNPEYFAKANITTAMLATMDTYIYHLENIVLGNRIETPLPFKSETRFWEHTVQLLPEFHTKAVRVNDVRDDRSFGIQTPAIDIASTTNDNIIKELEIGFQISDKNSGKCIKSEFTDSSIQGNSDAIQGFNKKLSYSGSIENIVAQPILKYTDKTIVCAPVSPLEGAALNNIFWSGVNGSSFGVGGAPIIGNKGNDETSLIIGNIMPIAATNPVFKKNRSFSMVSFIGEDGTPSGSNNCSIFGSWKSEDNSIALVLQSGVDQSVYNGESCTLSLNNPQAGIITLTSQKGETLIIRICELTGTALSIAFKNSSPIHLIRQ